MHTFLFAFFPQNNLQKIKEFYFHNKAISLLEAQNEEAYFFYIHNHRIDNFFFYCDTKMVDIKEILIQLHQLSTYTWQPCNLISEKRRCPSFDLAEFVSTKFFSMYNWENHQNRLIRLVEKSYETSLTLHSLNNEFFQIKLGKQITKIPLKDILYIESMAKKSILHTLDGPVTISVPLYKIQSSLPKNIFIQSHRSFVVNVHKIAKVDYETQRIEFSNSTAYALLSRAYRKIITIHSTQQQEFLL